MAIINRSKDPSEQVEVFKCSAQTQGVGFTNILAMVPYNCSLEAIAFGAIGLSGAPTFELEVVRVTAGGITVMTTFMAATALRNLGATSPLVLPAGTSLPGATFALQTGDLLRSVIAGANTAVEQLNVDIVVQKLQDFVTYHGVSVS